MNKDFLKDNIDRFNANCTRVLGGKNLRTWMDEVFSFIRFGCSPDDYFRYEFYRKSSYERNKFITYRRSQRIIRKYNDPSFVEFLQDKLLFNEKYRRFIGREYLDISKASKSEFAAFVSKHGEVLIKPRKGGQGKGITKLTEQGINAFDVAANQDYIAEEIIRQHDRMAELNITSVNTVRALTFKGKVIACALRVGGEGAFVDNLHSNGVCAHLDLETGIIDHLCTNNQLQKFLFHPSSHVLLAGFQVPNWEKVISLAEEASEIIPQVQYIGWDIAVTEKGVALIEGNHDPGHDVVQMIAQMGLYEEIKRLEGN